MCIYSVLHESISFLGFQEKVVKLKCIRWNGRFLEKHFQRRINAYEIQRCHHDEGCAKLLETVLPALHVIAVDRSDTHTAQREVEQGDALGLGLGNVCCHSIRVRELRGIYTA